MGLIKLCDYKYSAIKFFNLKYTTTIENGKTLFYKNGLLQKIVACQDLKRVSEKAWYDALEKVLYVFCENTIRIFRLKNIKYNFSFGLQGFYIYSETGIYFYDYKNKLEKIEILNFSIVGDIIYYLDNSWCHETYLYKMVKKETSSLQKKKFLETCVRIKPKSSFEFYIVNFKDCQKNINISILLEFQSEYINDQLENKDIYLDLVYQDFNINNQETLEYLNSNLLIRNLFVNKFLELYSNHLPLLNIPPHPILNQ